MLQKIQSQIFDEVSQKFLPIIDKTEEFLQYNVVDNPTMKVEKANFSKLKNDQLQSLKKKLQIPGGVGFGVYYSKEFQHNFTNLIVLDFSIAVAEKLGRTVTDYLYLTAINTSAKGVEAYVSYYRQNLPDFLIFDWSILGDDKWKLKPSYDKWSHYLFDDSIDSISVKLLRVINGTEKIVGNTWQNIFYLFNSSLQQWE